MERTCRPYCNRLFSSAGFTLTEVLVVIALMAIIGALSLPPFFEWRRNLNYKAAAMEIANSLKTAKSKAVTLNQPHGVTFVPAEGSYQIIKFQNGHWNYSSAVGVLKKNVALNLNGTAASAVPPLPNIRFNSNGTTFGNYTVRINDAAVRKYTVAVERSGRIKTSKTK